ncbi:MAG: PQQ-dependent sugar dehydrogenase [Acidimicrobiia bacterium]|nr:PQQ-dependent sugar dehydrogenase [Acidimicrobiia bacterium]
MTRRPPPPTPQDRFPALLFTPANRPFTIILVVAATALAAYLLQGGSDETPATTTSQPAASQTTAEGGVGTDPADPTSTVSADGTVSTDGSGATESPDVPLQGLAVETVSGGFTFPVFAASPPGDPRVFVVERAGRIRIIEPGGDIRGEVFLDISDRIDSASGVELGLLGLAFHPQYAGNGRFFVHYTILDTDTVVAEFAVGTDPNVADADSEKEILFVDQVGFRHRGGMLTFGSDGYLYIGIGDGTGMNVNPQNLETLPGSILRIDVDSGDPYAIPPDNPFAASEGKDEIWAYGLRNPWRFSFDETSGRIYVGDVGEESWEEIDSIAVANSGANFGWPFMEGTTCFTDASCGSRTDLVRPILEYPHEADQCAVTGGYVYRGSAIPEMVGHYFYADWCAGWVRSFLYDGENVTLPRDWSVSFDRDVGAIASFGLDGNGELLLVASDDGVVYRLVAAR